MSESHWSERCAAEFLRAQNLTFVDHNYRCKQGEIDLVMAAGDELVFVEVRYRRQSQYGSPAQTVGQQKQSKLIRAASHYLQHHKLTDKVACRFDVVGISGVETEPQFHWFKSAFTA